MSTPYWGQLPGPKVATVQRGGGRRHSEDYGPNDRRQSLDTSSQPQPRANRASVQTTNTESTLSPYASPTASSFPAQGLAPRPPTLPYGSSQYPPELNEKRQRRRSQRNEEFEESNDPAPPAAPEVPRAPPVSYRNPHGNGGPPPATGPPRSARQVRPPVNIDDMEPEEYYKEAAQERQQDYPPLDRSQRALNAAPGSKSRGSDAQQARRRSQGGTANGGGRAVPPVDTATQPRKASTGSQPPQRRKFADDRSPLQRLELTLDSITKEEKRARVEAAERRAREKLSPTAEPSQPQVRFRDRGVPGDPEEQRPRSIVVAGKPQPAIAAHKGPLSQNPPEEGRRYGSGTLQPRAPGAEPRTVAVASSGVPQRNLSFRDRAAKNDLKIPNGAEASSPTSPPVTTPSGGLSLTRSGSNKLRKEPPGDPWFSRRSDAEKKYSSVEKRNAAMDEAAGLTPVASVPRTATGSVREKPLPPGPDPEDLRQRGIPSKAAKLIGLDLGGIQRRSTAPAKASPPVRHDDDDFQKQAPVASGGRGPGTEDPSPRAEARRRDREDTDEESSESEHHHPMTKILGHGRAPLKPGEGMYQPPKYLDEWKKGTVGTLSGALLDLSDENLSSTDKNVAWWEGKRKNSMSGRPRKAEAFDGEYDETNAPTRFKPPLYLKCGPLLRYCGLRHEKIPTRSTKNGAIAEREIWRGSVMIVTQDGDSSYDIAPTLRLFVQPIELLPPPPQEISGEQPLPAEYVDPIAGHPKLGRRGETLYVRPVEHLEEEKDLSRDETDEGLFEKARSPPDVITTDGGLDLPGSFASRRKRIAIDGEKVSKYKDVRGFRLHAERGYTFWRFNIEVELGDKQQRIAYRINRGPSTGFWVPARGQSMNIMFYSCNGFSSSVVPDEFSGPDPMWRDVLNTHQTQPFHVMLGGGDQVYNDCLMDESKMFHDWLMMRNPLHKHNAPFTPAMQNELEKCYLERYCMWFSQGLYGFANSQIPMVNMWDDHDISDGYGSYAHHDMNSPVFRGMGAVAFKYYMLFQQQSVAEETEVSEPSWLLGAGPGPYIGELSRSLFMFLGSKVALLALDGRTERSEYDVVRDATWRRIMDRLYAEIKTGKTEHLLVLLGVPIAYPRLVWLENILTSRLMDPVKALGKLGMLGNKLNHIDGGVEVLDDLNDHWTARNHKKERSIIVEDLQDLAADKSVRVTFLSGDVHLAAVGQFYANPKLSLPKHKDFRYMPNVISSAIVNTPPPDLLADVLNKRNKIHHFDAYTEENMIPMFQHGVDGKPRNNKHLLPHRNWCSIREWAPGNTPPPTPPLSAYDRSPSPPPTRPGGGIMRRLSKTRGPTFRPDAPQPKDPRPPVSGGLFRSFSRRNSSDSAPPQQPGKLARTLSLTRSDFNPRNLFSRKPSGRRPDDGGINGQWGEQSEDDDDDYDDYEHPRTPPRAQGMSLRGGGTHDEYHEGDESYFSARPPARARTMGDERAISHSEQETPPVIRPFHRTPTGLSVKQMKKAKTFEVNLEGGLDISLNVEINPKDPAGITVPYRLLVPRLFWDDANEGATFPEPAPAGFKRLLSLRKKQPAPNSQHSLTASEEQITPGSGQVRAAPPAGREQGYE